MAATAINFKHKPFDPTKEHIRLPEVRKMVFRSTAWIYAEMKKGSFPSSVKIAPTLCVWRVEDIKSYLIETARKQGSGVVEGAINE
ncbi:helix-turn-helix transcriptional regulator [Citrobacter freundii]|nr:AlpA family phage regulatory protein [Citrobacter freundii]